MSLLTINAVKLSFGERDLLKEVNFSLGMSDRLALVGANGCGKSTLLNIIAGNAHADSGSIAKRKNLRMAYLPQSGIVHQGKTLRAEVEEAYAEYAEMLAEIDRIGIELQRQDLSESKMTGLLESHHEIQDHIQQSGYYSRSAQIQQVAKGLGFGSSDLERDCGEFSGGWQMRIALMKVLLSYPDVLLLDEPTNYLDLEAREWLKSFLKSFHGGVILVSHDKYFLDATISAVAELYQGRLKLYPGNFTSYETKRSLELEQILAAWKKQQEEIAHLESFVSRFRAKASKATQAQSRLKQLEKIELIEIPDGVKKVDFRFPDAPPSSELVLHIEELSKSYEGNPILAGVSFELKRGEKLAILGRNGAGKSTLMRILAGGDNSFGGSVKLGHKVRMAYFAQDAETSLDPELTVFEEVEKAVPDHPPQGLRNLLGAFLFSGDDIDKPIRVLSGGEKSRVALVKMLLSPANLLILDEPTNHLDLSSKDVLLHALRSFAGAVIFVSHDRSFLQDLATSLVELKASDPPGKASSFERFLGDWEYYSWKTATAAGLGAGSATQSPTQNTILRLPEESKISTSSGSSIAAQDTGRQRHSDDKIKKAAIRKLEREEEILLEKIDKIEGDIVTRTAELGLPEVYKDGAKTKEVQGKIAALESELSKTQTDWETISQKIEEARTDD